MTNEGSGHQWICPKCEKTQDTGESGRLSLGGICYDCDEIRRLTPTRGQVAEESQVPPAYRRGKFAEPSAWPAELLTGEPLASWKGKPWSVLLTGDSGAGKTTLGTELFYRAAIAGMRADGCLWVRAFRLCAALEGPDRWDWYKRASDARVALFDDFGREQSSGGALRLLEIIASRFDYQRPTVLTTNLPFVGAGGIEQLDAGLFRRLSEGYLVEMVGAWKP